MKKQRKHRLPAGHEILLELERINRAGKYDMRPKHNLDNKHLYLNLGRYKSRRPVSLAKKA